MGIARFDGVFLEKSTGTRGDRKEWWPRQGLRGRVCQAASPG